jgi:ribosomal protein S27E
MLASVMYNLDRRFVPVYCSGCMFVLFLYRVCMLASVMYNLDGRFVPVYCSGCMFVLFLYRVYKTSI